jgi:hypothetical protein
MERTDDEEGSPSPLLSEEIYSYILLFSALFVIEAIQWGGLHKILLRLASLGAYYRSSPAVKQELVPFVLKDSFE